MEKSSERKNRKVNREERTKQEMTNKTKARRIMEVYWERI